MKNLFAFLSFLACASHAVSQDSIQDITKQRNCVTATGMTVLGSWGAVNLIGGGVGWASTKGSHKFFYQMSTFWSVINVGLAGLGYWSAMKKMNQPLTPEESIKAQRKLEAIFLINSGLDLVYTGAGLYMKTRGDNRSNAMLQGYGSSIMLQGIFLFVFDGVMYKLQRNNGNKPREFLEKNTVAFDGHQIGIRHRL